jgi:hypothetical protein
VIDSPVTAVKSLDATEVVVVPALTIWVMEDDTPDGLYLPALPKYWAVMVCDPVVGYDTVQVAVSLPVPVSAEVVQPVIGVPPSKNSTLPVGLPVAGEVAVTVAV